MTSEFKRKEGVPAQSLAHKARAFVRSLTPKFRAHRELKRELHELAGRSLSHNRLTVIREYAAKIKNTLGADTVHIETRGAIHTEGEKLARQDLQEISKKLSPLSAQDTPAKQVKFEKTSTPESTILSVIVAPHTFVHVKLDKLTPKVEEKLRVMTRGLRKQLYYVNELEAANKAHTGLGNGHRMGKHELSLRDNKAKWNNSVFWYYDMAKFKAINTAFSEAVGDLLIKKHAQIHAAISRGSDALFTPRKDEETRPVTAIKKAATPAPDIQADLFTPMGDELFGVGQGDKEKLEARYSAAFERKANQMWRSKSIAERLEEIDPSKTLITNNERLAMNHAILTVTNGKFNIHNVHNVLNDHHAVFIGEKESSEHSDLARELAAKLPWLIGMQLYSRGVFTKLAGRNSYGEVMSKIKPEVDASKKRFDSHWGTKPRV